MGGCGGAARALLACAVALATAGAAGAAPRRVEAEGVAAAAEGRHAAVEAGLAEAVRRVAADLLGRGDDVSTAEVAKLLGGVPSDYTMGYRVAEDRGEADGAEGPVYEVLVDATVDADRIAAALRATGALARDAAPREAGVAVRLVVEPADSWTAIEALEARLRELGVDEVVPVGFREGRAEFDLASRRSPSRLLDALAADPPAGTRLVPLSADAGTLWVRLEALPEPAEAPPAD